MAEDVNFIASVRMPDTMQPVRDLTAEKVQLAQTVKGQLQEQVADNKKKEKESKFFGMSDEEILMNKEVFAQMGII